MLGLRIKLVKNHRSGVRIPLGGVVYTMLAYMGSHFWQRCAIYVHCNPQAGSIPNSIDFHDQEIRCRDRFPALGLQDDFIIENQLVVIGANDSNLKDSVIVEYHVVEESKFRYMRKDRPASNSGLRFGNMLIDMTFLKKLRTSMERIVFQDREEIPNSGSSDGDQHAKGMDVLVRAMETMMGEIEASMMQKISGIADRIERSENKEKVVVAGPDTEFSKANLFNTDLFDLQGDPDVALQRAALLLNGSEKAFEWYPPTHKPPAAPEVDQSSRPLMSPHMPFPYQPAALRITGKNMSRETMREDPRVPEDPLMEIMHLSSIALKERRARSSAVL